MVKLLPDIQKRKVDRFPMPVSGKGAKEIRAVPKLNHERSETTSTTVAQTLES